MSTQHAWLKRSEYTGQDRRNRTPTSTQGHLEDPRHPPYSFPGFKLCYFHGSPFGSSTPGAVLHLERLGRGLTHLRHAEGRIKAPVRSASGPFREDRKKPTTLHGYLTAALLRRRQAIAATPFPGPLAQNADQDGYSSVDVAVHVFKVLCLLGVGLHMSAETHACLPSSTCKQLRICRVALKPL